MMNDQIMMNEQIKGACTLTPHGLQDRTIDKASIYKEMLFLFFYILIPIGAAIYFFLPLISHSSSLVKYFGLPKSLYLAIQFCVLSLFTYWIKRRNDDLVKKIELESIALKYNLEIDFSGECLDLYASEVWSIPKTTTPIIDETLAQIPEVTLGSVHQTLTLPFCIIEKAEQSNDCIVLEQKTAISPNILYLHKGGITYTDFQRLQDAIPCLQGLTVDPQQFKQEPPTHES
jgi:hypothetical protein